MTTITNVGPAGATNVRVSIADWPGVLADALEFGDEASNEIGKSLGHLVRKRHHAS